MKTMIFEREWSVWKRRVRERFGKIGGEGREAAARKV